MLRLICRVWQIKRSTFLACKPSYNHLFYTNVRDVGSLYGCAKKKRKKGSLYECTIHDVAQPYKLPK